MLVFTQKNKINKSVDFIVFMRYIIIVRGTKKVKFTIYVGGIEYVRED